MSRRKPSVALVLLASFVHGCSTSAAIERRSGPTIVGRIDYSDGDRLYVSAGGERYAIERSDVVAIDHPGRIGQTIGAVTSGVGVGVLLLSPIVPDCSSRDPGAGPDCWDLRAMTIATGIGVLLVGLPILLGNTVVRARSRSAAEPARAAAPLPPKWQP